MALTPLSEALAAVLAEAPQPSQVEVLSLEDALFRVTSERCVSGVNVPPADNSAMDGYAVHSSAVPGQLKISQRIPAGAAPQPLEQGTAARIFTGAILPEGADTIIMQEDVLAQGDTVQILGCVTPGAHVRKCGADITQGMEVLPQGKLLTPQDIGLLASIGCDEVAVFRRLKVAVITTGDELREPGSGVIEPWQIYNSNRFQMIAQLKALGLDVVDMGRLPDDPQVIGGALEEAAERADCILTSGGVSVGEEDHVRNQIEARGSLKLWKLAIKPGKPLAFGAVNDTPIFGLPGNPVSSWATFALVVRPWLLKAQGASAIGPLAFSARADFSVDKPGSRQEFLRVTLDMADDGVVVASLAGSQSSGVLSSVSRGRGLAVIEIGSTVTAGDLVRVIPMSELLTPL